ncbi:MAG TPA: sulfatase-like hydrolase/transferase [Kofleriaceae bacterium]|nr:sulfatase-like hydrolase/transferase [Kofleriaceae bacterium]
MEPSATAPTESKVASIGGANVAATPAMQPSKAPSRGAEHVVYSLIDNRLSAHRGRGGGVVLDGGSSGFAKYVRFPRLMKSDAKKSWELRQTDGSLKVAKMTGKTASVFVPLTAAQAASAQVRLRINATEEGTLSLRVNEKKEKEVNVKLAKGWQTLTITAPAGLLVEGENTLQVFTKGSGSTVSWMQIGGKTAVPDEGPGPLYDTAQKALPIAKDAQLSWFVSVPDKARLTGDLSDGACTLGVLVTAEDGKTIEGKLNGIGSAVDLAAVAGKAVRIDLDNATCPTAMLSNAALVQPGDTPQVKRADPPKYVLFIIMDSLRADKIKAFNPKARPETPNWDKLAETSTLFMHHYSPGNESQVSHASMWTSAYLAKHKASEMPDKLAPDKWVTIDEVAKKAGKFVAGVSANGYIRPSRGFGTAWDKFVNHIEKSLGLRGADVMEKGLSFITPEKDKPWFLYLGMIDTHVTWRAKSPWIEKYDGGYKGRFEKSFGDDGPGGFPKDLTDAERDHVRALYDSNVSYQDDLLGKLVAKLQEWGIYDQTMIIVTADHGDELWEDGKTIGHAKSQHQTLIHIPMLIRYPAMFPAGKVLAGSEGIDIVPTLADALGVAIDPEWQGASLLPLAQGVVSYPLLSTSSQFENFHAGRIGDWKLRLAGTGTPQLYQLANDPGEKKDLWGTPGSAIASRMLLDPMWMLRQWNTEWKKSAWGNPAVVTSRFAADLGE